MKLLAVLALALTIAAPAAGDVRVRWLGVDLDLRTLGLFETLTLSARN